MGDYGKRNLVHAPLALHCVGLLTVRSGIDDDPPLIGGADQYAVSLSPFDYLDSDRLELRRNRRRQHKEHEP